MIYYYHHHHYCCYYYYYDDGDSEEEEEHEDIDAGHGFSEPQWFSLLRYPPELIYLSSWKHQKVTAKKNKKDEQVNFSRK